VEGLETTIEASCTTFLAEEGHASGAVALKNHEYICQATLQALSMVHQCRGLTQPTVDELKIDRLRHKIAKLDKKKPQTNSARNLFIRQLVQETTPVLKDADKNGEGYLRATCCVEESAALYNVLPPRAKAQYDADVTGFVRQRQNEIAKAKSEHEDAIEAIENKVRLDREENGLRNHVKSFRFTQEELERMSEKINSDTYSRMNLEMRKNEWRESPQVPPEPNQQALLDAAATFVQPAPAPPWWIGRVLHNKSLFEYTAFCYGTNGVAVAYLFLYVKGNPRVATFLEMRRRPADPGLPPHNLQVFNYFPFKHILEKDLQFDNEDEMMCILPGVRFVDHVLVSMHAAQTFPQFLSERLRPPLCNIIMATPI